MDRHVAYDTLRAYRVNHKLILGLAESLDDDQLLWKPAGYNNSIGFNLWHIARWSDNLIAEILQEFPDLDVDMGESTEIWEQESLAERWGLPPVLYPGGTGLSDEAVDGLIFPAKDEMLAYLRKTFSRTEEFIEKFDARYSDPITDETLHKTITDIRWNLYYYLMHHCRHLGMMEALKGLLTGRGSAAA